MLTELKKLLTHKFVIIMAKVKPTMLYALKATVRRFDNATEPTIAIIVGDNKNFGDTRVYKSLSHPWVDKICKSFDEELDRNDLREADDNFEIQLDEPVALENGFLINEEVPPMMQYFTDQNGNEVSRVVRTVKGAITEASKLSTEAYVRGVMSFRLTALDEKGQHRYGVPTRKKIREQLYAYFEGDFERDYTNFVDDVNKFDLEENE